MRVSGPTPMSETTVSEKSVSEDEQDGIFGVREELNFVKLVLEVLVLILTILSLVMGASPL